MNAREIATIRADFARILERADDFAIQFYDRLFEIGPDLQQLLPIDLPQLRLKLLDTLTVLVDALDDGETARTALQAIGAQFGRLEVAPHHYVMIGEALLDTLERELGELGDTARHAWVKAYTLLSDQVAEARRQLTVTDMLADAALG